jgi:hypothetical protein
MMYVYPVAFVTWSAQETKLPVDGKVEGEVAGHSRSDPRDVITPGTVSREQGIPKIAQSRSVRVS